MAEEAGNFYQTSHVYPDASGLAEVSFFTDEMEQYRRIVMQAGPVWVRGKVTEHLSTISVEGRNWGAAA
jgi:hypothetical protein